MTLRLPELQDRFRAAALGFAVGDALGLPIKGLPPRGVGPFTACADDYVSRPRGGFSKGQFSDDTQVMLAVSDAVARERRIDGRAVGAHFSWLWQEGVVLQAAPACTRAAEALLAGTPWMSAGADVGVRDPSCLSRGVVTGLWSEGGPSRLAHDAQVLTVVTHKDPACTAAVSVVGRAIQLGIEAQPMTGAQLCEALSQAAAVSDGELADEIFYLPRVLNWEPDRALNALRRIGVPAAQLENEPGLPAHVTPVLLSALYAFLRSPTDFRGAVSMVLRRGGEVDVAAGLVGALLGANLGCEGIPARLKRNLLYGEAIVEAADRLFDARVATSPTVTRQYVTARR